MRSPVCESDDARFWLLTEFAETRQKEEDMKSIGFVQFWLKFSKVLFALLVFLAAAAIFMSLISLIEGLA